MENRMSTETLPRADSRTERIEMPDTTAWPIILAFGLTLVFAGMVTSPSVSLLGAILAMSGVIGWFRDVLPHEKHESGSAIETLEAVSTMRPQVSAVSWMTEELHRARLPLEVYPIKAGAWGGMAGSVAMAILALMYGVFRGC